MWWVADINFNTLYHIQYNFRNHVIEIPEIYSFTKHWHAFLLYDFKTVVDKDDTKERSIWRLDKNVKFNEIFSVDVRIK